MKSIIIEKRFCGPPNSANGGYVCGLLAAHIDGNAEITLLAPPPLGQRLDIVAGEHGVELRKEKTTLAMGRRVQVDVPEIPMVSFREAQDAVRRSPYDAGRSSIADVLCVWSGACARRRPPHHSPSCAAARRLQDRNARGTLGALFRSGGRGWRRCRRVCLGRIGLPNGICRRWRAAPGNDRRGNNSSRTHECARRETALPGRSMHHCRVADRQGRPQTICRQRITELGRQTPCGRAGNLASGGSKSSARRVNQAILQVCFTRPSAAPRCAPEHPTAPSPGYREPTKSRDTPAMSSDVT